MSSACFTLPLSSSSDMSSVLKELEPGLSSEPCVDHALRLRSSWALGNYHRFFRLYRSAPNMGGSLMDMFVERERKTALKAMAKAYVVVITKRFFC